MMENNIDTICDGETVQIQTLRQTCKSLQEENEQLRIQVNTLIKIINRITEKQSC